MKLPKIGNLAPAFSLLNQDGEAVAMKDFRDNNPVVLYFYPKAMTPGCTMQACGLRDLQPELKKRRVIVLGISPDSVTRLQKFSVRESLNFDLLSDPDHTIAERYGVWGPKKFMGRDYEGIHRVTFVVGIDGRLRHVMTKVRTKNHANDLLQVLDTCLG